MIAADLAERARDVGIALYECNKYQQTLGRLQLQKVIYLADTLAACVHILSVKSGHKIHFYGPYDRKIQDVVDLLVFRGLLNASQYKLHRNNQIQCTYSITNPGKKWVNTLLGSSETFRRRAQLLGALVSCLAGRNAFSDLRHLVYAEPTYLEAKGKGNDHPLHLELFETNLSAQAMALFIRSMEQDRMPIPLKLVADVFVEFLFQRRLSLGVIDEQGEA